MSPGVAIARGPNCIRDLFVGDDVRPLADADVRDELDRFEAARAKAGVDLQLLYKKVHAQLGEQPAAVFLAHEAILHDPALTEKVRAGIVDSKLPAQAALQRVLNEYTELFAFTTDEFLKERLADIRDVVIRISGHLADKVAAEEQAGDDDEPCVLVAGELLPSHVFALGQRPIVGIVTEAGGRTSHAAILSRSRGIPAVRASKRLWQQASHGVLIVVDGREGHVIVNPDYETLTAYKKLQREFAHLKETLAEIAISRRFRATESR